MTCFEEDYTDLCLIDIFICICFWITERHLFRSFQFLSWDSQTFLVIKKDINVLLYLRSKDHWPRWFACWLLSACGKPPSSSSTGCCTETEHLRRARRDKINGILLRMLKLFSHFYGLWLNISQVTVSSSSHLHPGTRWWWSPPAQDRSPAWFEPEPWTCTEYSQSGSELSDWSQRCRRSPGRNERHLEETGNVTGYGRQTRFSESWGKHAWAHTFFSLPPSRKSHLCRVAVHRWPRSRGCPRWVYGVSPSWAAGNRGSERWTPEDREHWEYSGWRVSLDRNETQKKKGMTTEIL